MAEPASLERVRAAVEAVVPPVDGRPGAADLGVEEHVAALFELYIPGFVDLMSTLLDAYAVDVRPGTTFPELSLEERGEVLRLMAREDSQDVHDIVDGLMVFTYGGMYSEWTGYQRETGSLVPPATWAHLGFHGRSEGHPNYREGI